MLIGLTAALQGVGHKVERVEDDAVKMHRGAPVRLELLWRPNGGERLHQLGG